MEKVIVQLGENNTELVISEGFQKKPQKAVSISGSLYSPREFYRARKSIIDAKKDKTHILVDVQKATVRLIVDETNPFDSYVIEGKMIPFEDFEAFRINTGTRFEKNEIISLLKKSKVYFPDKEDWSRLLMTFQKFITKVTKDFENSDNQKGQVQKLEAYSGALQGFRIDGEKEEFNPEFILELPLFVGEEKVRFTVQICLDPVDTKMKFYLESIDLHEKGKEMKEIALSKAIKPFIESGDEDSNGLFPVIFI